ncbi:glycoside hydrolase family 31 protein [Colletotrichum gloeosporioides 23]|nr:glycoside hydrolase family 31 protein [Colletotrichum gloeosporioides 23]
MSAPKDLLNFIPADVFYNQDVPNFEKSTKLLNVQSSTSELKDNNPLRYAAQVSLSADDGTKPTQALVQFVTPQIWRIRYNPKFTKVEDYPNDNSRTIVMNKFSDLVDQLKVEYRESLAWNAVEAGNEWNWNTTFNKISDVHWVLTSKEYKNKADTAGTEVTSLHFLAEPFRIIATRKLDPSDVATLTDVGITTTATEHVIWRTTTETFCHQDGSQQGIGAINNVVLNIEKPGPAQYLGFGEQGGRTVLKEPTYMNYFCYDNFNYQKVYGQGPLDTKEPLYHSTPFYLEMNGTPGFRNVTGLMVDNYSQVAIDLGKKNASTIGVATRFGNFDAYVMTADDVPRMIWQYTSLVGRPKLKPRFILGHHQGCDPGYGYQNTSDVMNVANRYHDLGFPLDGMHLDVDFQVSLPSDFPANGCTRYDGGYATPSYLNPNDLNDRITFADDPNGATPYRDDYVFMQLEEGKPPGNYNSGYPFHGGVSYGSQLGTVGYYPDLNRAVARETWGKQYQQLFDDGLEFVWQDMTTPAAGNCYGDMLGFPSRLLMSEDTINQQSDKKPDQKTAIELWALYSYNLHKATYHGLNKLKGRENKRNFIIGRGSQTGMHRFAGLWTGDNGSSWDFWRISVSQVLALGYSGLTIAGVDMGGFTPDPHNQPPAPRWCDPELLVRWYTGAFLLPWYRNHYIQHFDSKAFQEPFKYGDALGDSRYSSLIPSNLQTQYASVMPLCRYYVQLRYSLMQVLYDAMFANLIHGLPIARAMLITDPDDTSLFNDNDEFIDNQYLLGHNIMVCPVLNPGVYNRDVYLPGTDHWYPSNLRVNAQGFGLDPIFKHAAQLEKSVPGGSTISFGCGIPDAVHDPEQMAFVTPVYIREGAIIPQIDVRQSIEEKEHNPVTIHVYPGRKHTEYNMFLDDGVSRDSAPDWLPQFSDHPNHPSNEGAGNKYRDVHITQDYQNKTSRSITISHPWDNFDAIDTVGDTYYFAIWAVKDGAPTNPSQVDVTFKNQDGHDITDSKLAFKYDTTRAVVSVEVPVHLVPKWTRASAGAPPTAKPYLSISVTGLK